MLAYAKSTTEVPLVSTVTATPAVAASATQTCVRRGPGDTERAGDDVGEVLASSRTPAAAGSFVTMVILRLIGLCSRSCRYPDEATRNGATGRRSGSASGHGRQDRQLVAVGHRSVEAIEEADVLAAQVHVHEAAQAAAVVGHPRPQLAVLGVEAVERLPHRRAVDLRLGLVAGGVAQLRRQLDPNGHHATAANASSNSSTDGAISVTVNVSRTVSSVFSPSPVM